VNRVTENLEKFFAIVATVVRDTPMAPPRAQTLINSWETVRYELLNTRLCDLGLRVEDSAVEPYIRRLYRELESKGLRFRPHVYLTDGWGCPNEVPIIGMPFYLVNKYLARIEEEQTGEVEDDQMVMMFLRHESGHAVNYAYRLWENEGWTDIFGPFTKPYRDQFSPQPFSRQFVRHLAHHRHGRTYAQKHPDEDFAETFAVWLTPRSSWRRKYRTWPALRKLIFVDKLMGSISGELPKVTDGERLEPIEEMDTLLAEHYGQRAERYRAAAQGYVDDKLRSVFPETKMRAPANATDLLRQHEENLAWRVHHWSGLDIEEVRTILVKLTDRAEALGLQYRPRDTQSKLMDLMALTTSLAMDFAYTGRLTGE
jgi:hypothetical protein